MVATPATIFQRNTGSFAASLVTTLWERSETQHQTRLAEVMGGPAGLSGPMSDALNQATQFGLTTAQGAGVIVRQISSQAFLLATIDLFRISSIVILLLVSRSGPETLVENLETGAAFWHMVDLVWVILYPLVYLIR